MTSGTLGCSETPSTGYLELRRQEGAPHCPPNLSCSPPVDYHPFPKMAQRIFMLNVHSIIVLTYIMNSTYTLIRGAVSLQQLSPSALGLDQSIQSAGSESSKNVPCHCDLEKPKRTENSN